MAWNAPDSPSSAKSRTIPSASASSSADGPASPDTETSEMWTFGSRSRSDDGRGYDREPPIRVESTHSLDAVTRQFVFEARVARNGRGAPEAISPPLKAQSGQTGKGDAAPLVAFQTTGGTHSLDAGPLAPPLKVGSGIGIPSPPSICWLGDSPAKTSPSRASASDSAAPAPPSSMNSFGSPASSSPPTASSRMFQGSFLPMMDETSGLSSQGYDQCGLLSAGGCWTADFSESPSDGVESTLSAVLQKTVSARFFLSGKAARGILKRAAKRGRTLPTRLQRALEAVSLGADATAKRRSSRTP